MAAIIKRLAGPAALTTSAATQYTTPAATKARIRTVHVSNPTASSVTFTLSIGTDAAGKRIYDAITIPANTDTVTRGVLVLTTDMALEPADILQAFSSVVTTVLTISGEERPLG